MDKRENCLKIEDVAEMSKKGQQLCSLAALFENHFSLDWIIEILGHKASHVLSVLEEAMQLGWIEKEAGGFFCFKDITVKKSLSNQLSLKEKQSFHRKIAEMFLKELPDTPKRCDIVAHHLLFVQNDLNGCREIIKKADHCLLTSSYTEAMRYYTKALADLHEIKAAKADSLFIRVVLKYAKISIAREDTGKVKSILQEAVEKARKLDKNSELSMLQMHLAKNEFLQGEYSSASDFFEKAWITLEESYDSRMMISTTAFRIFYYFWRGQLNEVIRTYEESMSSAIEEFPTEGQPILASAAVGYCYAYTGQIKQGLGMLHALRRHCLEKGDAFLAHDSEVALAGVMLDLRRPDETLSYLDAYFKEDCENDWNAIRAKMALFLAFFLKENKRETIKYFNDWMKRVNEINVSVIINVLWFEFCKAIYDGKFPSLEGVCLESEVSRFEKCDNVLMKGVAFRYRAFIQERENQGYQSVMESLNLSAKYLMESGHIFELCRTYLELSRVNSLVGNHEAAAKMRKNISDMIDNSNMDLVPPELQWFLKKAPRDWQCLCNELIELGQDISATRDMKQLLQLILSMANRMTGAERGAIFRIFKDKGKIKVRLAASKNITSEEINHDAFSPILGLVAEVAATRETMHTISRSDNLCCAEHEHILSQIFVPMVIRNRVIGVLYHDNTHYVNSFDEPEIKLIGGFASQAAIALDHAEAYEEIKRLNEKLYNEQMYYKEQTISNSNFDEIIGVSAAIREVLNKIDQVANTDTTVLILGETGVGKDLVARALHRHSKRAKNSFIKVLCNALPESLIASELFGHEKGAFTGSVQRRIGRFELADGGTIFLDEIGDLKLDVQTQLLQVIQSKEFERVGGSETIRSDFRLITATNHDLADAAKSGRFRSDLYYRLNVFPIYVPPLRDRKEDIPLLSLHFLKNFSERMGKKFDGIPQNQIEKLMSYDWPGNIRELEGIIERATVLSQDFNFRVPELSVEPLEYPTERYGLTMKENERAHILRTLKKTGWKVRGKGGAAELLDINYSTLFFRMKKLGITRPPNNHTRGKPKPH